MSERWLKTSTVPVSEQLLEFFLRDPNDFLWGWWPWTKLGYITMTRRQSNNQWSDGIVAHPTPKYSECKNPLKKFSPRFFGIKTASSSLITLKRAKLSTSSINHLCWCNSWTFWRKNAVGRSPSGSCSCTTMRRLTGHLQPRIKTGLRGLQMSWPPTLFSGSGPVGLPSVPWTERQLKGRHFSSDAEITAAAETLLEGQTSDFFYQKLVQRAKRCIELRGEYAESRVWSL